MSCGRVVVLTVDAPALREFWLVCHQSRCAIRLRTASTGPSSNQHSGQCDEYSAVRVRPAESRWAGARAACHPTVFRSERPLRRRSRCRVVPFPPLRPSPPVVSTTGTAPRPSGSDSAADRAYWILETGCPVEQAGSFHEFLAVGVARGRIGRPALGERRAPATSATGPAPGLASRGAAPARRRPAPEERAAPQEQRPGSPAQTVFDSMHTVVGHSEALLLRGRLPMSRPVVSASAPSLGGGWA